MQIGREAAKSWLVTFTVIIESWKNFGLFHYAETFHYAAGRLPGRRDLLDSTLSREEQRGRERTRDSLSMMRCLFLSVHGRTSPCLVPGLTFRVFLINSNESFGKRQDKRRVQLDPRQTTHHVTFQTMSRVLSADGGRGTAKEPFITSSKLNCQDGSRTCDPVSAPAVIAPQ